MRGSASESNGRNSVWLGYNLVTRKNKEVVNDQT